MFVALPRTRFFQRFFFFKNIRAQETKRNEKPINFLRMKNLKPFFFSKKEKTLLKRFFFSTRFPFAENSCISCSGETTFSQALITLLLKREERIEVKIIFVTPPLMSKFLNSQALNHGQQKNWNAVKVVRFSDERKCYFKGLPEMSSTVVEFDGAERCQNK